MNLIPTMTICFWCGREGVIEKPQAGTAVPATWKILPLIVTADLKPKMTRLQRFADTRVPFCPDYGTDKCQAPVARNTSADEVLLENFRAFLSRVRASDFGCIED